MTTSGDIRPEEDASTSKVERITEQSKALVEDVKRWVDLKIRLLQAQVEERIEQVANRAVSAVILAVLALLTLVFALITSSIAIGAWLGNLALGFLVITGVLLLSTLLFHFLKPSLIGSREKKAADSAELEAGKPPPQLPAKEEDNAGI